MVLIGGRSAVSANHAGSDAVGGVAEDIALAERLASYPWSSDDWEIHTATMFKKPMTKTMMPEPITILQKAKPRDCWLVACLLRFPSILIPSTIMAMPRATKPWLGLSRGQRRAKYERKRETSEQMRKTRLRKRGSLSRFTIPLTADRSSDDVTACIEKEELTAYQLYKRH